MSRTPLRRRRWLVPAVAVVGLSLAAATGVVLAVRPSDEASRASTRTATSLATVKRQDLMAQTQVDGTLGYAGSRPVIVPSGTDPTTLRQATAAVETATANLAGDRVGAADTAASGRHSVAVAKAAVAAAERALATARYARDVGCATPSAVCAQARRAVTTAREQLGQARDALVSARLQASAADHQGAAKLAADRTALSTARAALDQARRQQAGPGGTCTRLASVGSVVRRGQTLYAVDGAQVPLLYGSVVPWRALRRGVRPGSDVAALNDNLAALGHGTGLAGRRDFGEPTETALRAWQRARHAKVTGVFALGDAVYRPGPVVVTSVTAKRGSTVRPGSAILTTGSATRSVSVALAAARQGQVSPGDAVTVTLPDGKSTPGRVASVGRVATGSGAKATIAVRIALSRPKAAAGLDAAPVLVGITTASAEHALVVPVNALLSLAGGGYAVEVVGSGGARDLVAVRVGLFDDAKGLVEVTGTTLKVGQGVVVPGS